METAMRRVKLRFNWQDGPTPFQSLGFNKEFYFNPGLVLTNVKMLPGSKVLGDHEALELKLTTDDLNEIRKLIQTDKTVLGKWTLVKEELLSEADDKLKIDGLLD